MHYRSNLDIQVEINFIYDLFAPFYHQTMASSMSEIQLNEAHYLFITVNFVIKLIGTSRVSGNFPNSTFNI